MSEINCIYHLFQPLRTRSLGTPLRNTNERTDVFLERNVILCLSNGHITTRRRIKHNEHHKRICSHIRRPDVQQVILKSHTFLFCVRIRFEVISFRFRKAQARENLFLSIITNGEGYHNYHHTFPYDYKASDRGKFNVSTYVIDMFAKLGLAYDLQEVGTTSVKKMLEKHGTH